MCYLHCLSLVGFFSCTDKLNFLCIITEPQFVLCVYNTHTHTREQSTSPFVIDKQIYDLTACPIN